jgi:hypothetical protein
MLHASSGLFRIGRLNSVVAASRLIRQPACVTKDPCCLLQLQSTSSVRRALGTQGYREAKTTEWISPGTRSKNILRRLRFVNAGFSKKKPEGKKDHDQRLSFQKIYTKMRTVLSKDPKHSNEIRRDSSNVQKRMLHVLCHWVFNMEVPLFIFYH